MNFNLNLTDNDLYILSKALEQMPYYQVVELIEKINKQISIDNKSIEETKLEKL